MFHAAIIFFVLAMISVIFGANGIAGVSIEIGELLLFVFLALAVISFIAAMVSSRPPKQLH